MRKAVLSFRVVFAALVTFGPAPAAAQRAVIPPVRPLGRIIATAKDTLRTILGVHVLSDGRILINDPGAHRLVLFDSGLTRATVVMDSAGAAVRAYPQQSGAVLRYVGDSTLFFDPVALALLMIDPTGKIARIVAVPPNLLLGTTNAAFGAEPGGRFIYSAPMGPIAGLPDSAGRPTRRQPDSVLVFRIDLTSRRIDTLATLRSATSYPRARVTAPDGFVYGTPVINPIAVRDDWALLPDGTVAVVRAQDFHVDWLAPDGTRSVSPKIAHEWYRLSDSDKVAIIDSARAGNTAPIGIASVTRNGVTTTYDMIPQLPPAADLPDYQAPFAKVLADADGNLWIQELAPETYRSSQTLPAGGPVYELVNRRGELFDRVRIPGGTVIVGFGPGIVYLSSRTGTGYSIARARMR